MSLQRRLMYYQGASRFWLESAELQANRCLNPLPNSQTARADINFFVVAVERIREVARLSADRAGLSGARAALERFDAAWPRFRELRNLEEHSLGPGAEEAPYGIWYFSDQVTELGPGGSVRSLVRVRETLESARRLASDLDSLLSTALQP